MGITYFNTPWEWLWGAVDCLFNNPCLQAVMTTTENPAAFSLCLMYSIHSFTLTISPQICPTICPSKNIIGYLHSSGLKKNSLSATTYSAHTFIIGKTLSECITGEHPPDLKCLLTKRRESCHEVGMCPFWAATKACLLQKSKVCSLVRVSDLSLLNEGWVTGRDCKHQTLAACVCVLSASSKYHLESTVFLVNMVIFHVQNVVQRCD